MYCRVNEGSAFQCLTSGAYSVSVKDLIICDLGMVALQNHLVGTVSLSGGVNLERS